MQVNSQSKNSAEPKFKLSDLVYKFGTENYGRVIESIQREGNSKFKYFLRNFGWVEEEKLELYVEPSAPKTRRLYAFTSNRNDRKQETIYREHDYGANRHYIRDRDKDVTVLEGK